MSINNAETLPRPLLNTTCDQARLAEGTEGRGEATANISPRPGIIHESFVYLGYFLFVIPFLRAAEQLAAVSSEEQ